MFGHCPLIIDVTAGAAEKNKACLLCGSAGEARSTETAGLGENSPV